MIKFSTVPLASILRHATSTACVVALLIGASAETARAHTYPNGSCWSLNHKDSGPLSETRNTCSLADGTWGADAYFHAVSSWGEVSNLAVTASYVDSACTVTLGNWQNDIARVARSDIDGWNGKTTYAHINACLSPPGSGNWGESDSRIASDLDTAARAPSDLYPDSPAGIGVGRSTMVHEIGHQLGLGHDSSYMNIMTTPGDKPGGPLGPVPYPDDISGVAGLYGTKTFTNIFASGQRWDAQALKTFNNHESVETVCLGNSFVAQVTVVNPGSTDVTYDQQVLLDDDADGSSPVATFSWASATTARQSFSSFAFSISTLGVTPGTYFLIHRVDSSQQLAESREDDNTLVYTGQIVVSDCQNILAFAANSILYL